MDTTQANFKSSSLASQGQRLLLVEDESRLLTHLEQLTREAGFSTVTCESYGDLDGLAKSSQSFADIIILDRLLHGRDAADLVPVIKQKFPLTSILVLSAINTASEKASLLDLGADDYMQKPFDPAELVARIRALTRRTVTTVALGNLSLNLLERTMQIDGRDVVVTNKEFILLKTLASTPGKIYNKPALSKEVWDLNAEVESNVVETTVNKLRRRLSEAGANIKVKNIRNVGYWIEE